MARIRSVHPGLFTDETFAQLSDAAQIFWIGLWGEADDQGVFPWKPLTLKMRLRPASLAPVEPLLDELVAADCIKQYEVGGRKYGVVRNFGKYQSPKKPNHVHPLPPEYRTYAALKGAITEPSPDDEDQFPPAEEPDGPIGRVGSEPGDDNEALVPNLFPTGTVPVPHQYGICPAEGGEEDKKERTSNDVPKKSRFEDFWAVYPSRGGAADPKKPAEDKFDRLVKGGADPDEIILGVKNYALERRAAGKDGTEFVMQAMTFLNKRAWEGFQAPPRSPALAFDRSVIGPAAF